MMNFTLESSANVMGEARGSQRRLDPIVVPVFQSHEAKPSDRPSNA